jgi:hypothetical protein
MTLTKNVHPWANDGTQESDTTLTNTKRDTGWVGGDRPSKERFNRIQYDIDNDLNQIKEEVPTSYSTINSVAVQEAMISEQLWYINLGVTSNAANEFCSAGSSLRSYVELCSFFDPDTNSPMILALDQTTCKVYVIDPRALNPGYEPSIDSSDLLSDDLPSGSGQTWIPVSMACDNTYVYIIFRDTNASPDTYQIQSWDVATWDVNPGWASTGTALPVTGDPVYTSVRPSKVIVASSSKLATLNCPATITANTTAAVSILDKTDGSIDASGAGDAPTGVTARPYGSIASDGINIYFMVYEASTPSCYLCTATIADPTAGTGGSDYPLQNSGAYYGLVCAIGGLVVSCYSTTYASEDPSDLVIRTHKSTAADLDYIYRGQNPYSTPAEAQNYLYTRPLAMCFDGINIWIYCTNQLVDSGATYYRTGLLKIDAAKLLESNQDHSTFKRQLTDVAIGPFLINGRAARTNTSANTAYMSIAFDGRDIFCNWDVEVSQTYSGRLYRLAKAILRS